MLWVKPHAISKTFPFTGSFAFCLLQIATNAENLKYVLFRLYTLKWSATEAKVRAERQVINETWFRKWNLQNDYVL